VQRLLPVPKHLLPGFHPARRACAARGARARAREHGQLHAACVPAGALRARGGRLGRLVERRPRETARAALPLSPRREGVERCRRLGALHRVDKIQDLRQRLLCARVRGRRDERTAAAGSSKSSARRRSCARAGTEAATAIPGCRQRPACADQADDTPAACRPEGCPRHSACCGRQGDGSPPERPSATPPDCLPKGVMDSKICLGPSGGPRRGPRGRACLVSVPILRCAAR
jgi:hypothetical protein